MLVARNLQPNNLVQLPPVTVRALSKPEEASATARWRRRDPGDAESAGSLSTFSTRTRAEKWREWGPGKDCPETTHLLYLFVRQLEWEQHADPSAAWEVIEAARSLDPSTGAHARSLLGRSEKIEAQIPEEAPAEPGHPKTSGMEASLRTPYGLEIIESCVGCKVSGEGFFCRFSPPVLRAVDMVSHHSIMPAGALLFVEGQTPRGIFIVCSGKVKLSTTSKDGKVLILKQAEAGEVLGLSASISCTNYAMSAETATPCQLNYIGRQDFMNLLQTESEVGVHASLWLSREFQGAYRDIHDLVLARSSSGKLARLLLASAHPGLQESEELHLRSAMTHEEMAQRIGSSRETVTRLLSDLKRKRLIRLEGAKLVIRDRTGLEALAV